MISHVFTVVLITWSVHGQKLHEYMTKEEIQSVFNVKPHEIHNIEYEVAPIFHKDEETTHGVRRRRSAPTIHLKAFNQDYTLYLEENTNLLFASDIPIFRAVKVQGSSEIKYVKKNYPLPRDFKLYHNRQKRAAVAVYTDANNRAHINGRIGDELTIRALPDRVHNHVINSSKQIENYLENPEYTSFVSGQKNVMSSHHVIMKPGKILADKDFGFHQAFQYLKKYVGLPNELNPVASNPKPNNPLPKYEPAVTRKPVESLRKPSTVYPEILVAVDHETYEIHGRDVGEFIKYMASFWNAVDLRFRELNEPAVRLHISAFIIPETPEAAPYFENHLYGDNLILVDEVLKNVGEYFKTNQEKFGVFDVVVAHSHRKMGSFDGEGTLSDTTSGLAYLEGTCSIKDGIAAAVIRDFGSFDGVLTAAHELAHSMGAPHDERDSAEARNGPCSWENGYIMSYKKIDSRAFHWSRCSLTAMRKFFTSRNGACLRNKPTDGKPYPKVLPGRIMSRNEQCALRHGTGFEAAEYSENECTILNCQKITKTVRSGRIYTNTRTESMSSPTAEGTSCANDQGICLDGECVQDPRPSY